jgi:hypothetical protein
MTLEGIRTMDGKTINFKYICKGILVSILFVVLSVATAFAADLRLLETNISNGADTLTVPIIISTPTNENVSSVEFTVYFDNTLLALTSVEITNNLVTSQKLVAFNQIAADQFKVLVYGLSNTVINDGEIAYLNFSLSGALPDSQLDIRVINALASSPAAANVSTTIYNERVACGTGYPEIEITHPVPASTISRTSSLFRATVSDGTVPEVTVYVNGDSLSAEYTFIPVNGFIDETIDLENGANRIRIVGYNSSAQMGMDEIFITVDTSILAPPQFLNQSNVTNSTDFRLEWTDESGSGAAEYELKRTDATVRPDEYIDGLLSYWCFDEASGTGYDAIGDTHLEPFNNVGSGSGLFGESARSFNSSYFGLGGASQNKFNLGEEFSITFWINHKDINHQGGIIDKDMRGNSGWAVFIRNAKIELLTSRDGKDRNFLVSSRVLNEHEWYHIGITWKKNGTARIYINGICDAEIINPGYSPYPTSNPVWIGARGYWGTAGYLLNAKVKDLAVWSRSMLPDDISALYQSGIPVESRLGEAITTQSNYYDEVIAGDGAYVYTVRALTAEGIASEWSDLFRITLDTTPPVAPTLAALPALTKETTMVLSGTKSADTAVITIDASNMIVDQITYPSAATWNASVTFTQDGAYDIAVLASDAAGNESTGVWGGVTRDTLSPTISSVTTNPGSAVISAGTVLIVEAVGEAGCSASFNINGVTQFRTMTETTPGNYRGTYTVQAGDDIVSTRVTVKLVDLATNESLRNSAHTFSIDTIPPVITTVTENTNGRTLAPGDQVLVVIEGEAGQSARFTIEGVVSNKSMVQIASGRYQGIHTVQSGDDISNAKVTGILIDAAGNARYQDALTTINIDTVPPVVTVTSHTNNQVVTAREVTIQGTVDDATVTSVEVQGLFFPVTNGQFSAQVDFETEGFNTINISATDAAGNVGHAILVLKLVFPPEVPNFTAPIDQLQNGDFRLEWTDESGSGAAEYELKRTDATVRPDEYIDGLLSYWCFDEASGTGYDAIGDTHLEPFNNVGSGSGLFGESARSFNSSYFGLGGASQNKFNLGEEFSITFWINHKDINHQGGIIDKDMRGNSGWAVFIRNAKIELLTSRDGKDRNFLVSSRVLNEHEWYHIGITWKKNGTARIYINGICDAEIINPGYSPYPTSNPVWIGARGYWGTADYFLNAKVKDLAVWSRSMLPDDISALYQSGIPVELRFGEAITTQSNYYDEVIAGDGAYVYTVRALTAEGIASEWSDLFTISVDSTPPVAPTLAALPALTKETTMVLSGTKSADTAMITMDATNMTVDQVTYPSATTWQASVTFTQDGAYSIALIASDAADNNSTVVWGSITRDTTPPVVAISSPSNGYTTPQKSVTINGTVNDPTVSSIIAQISNGGGASSQTLTVANGTFSFPYSLYKGVNTFTFRATDAAGNIGSVSRQISFSNNLPLVFLPIGNKAIGFDETIQFTVSLLNQNQIHPELLTISATGLPGSGESNPAVFNPLTGVFTWTPTEAQLGLYQDITFIAQDDNKMTTETIKIVVQRYDIDPNDFQSIMGSPNNSQVIIDDFNKDGFPDIYMVNIGANAYYVNNQDGTFTERAEMSGCDDPGVGVSALSFDANKDGYPDLYIVNDGANTLLLNDGHGSFTDASAQIPQNSGQGVVAYAHDFNGDGSIDILLVNKNSNVLFINNGNGQFNDLTGISGLQPNNAAVGACVADIDGDQDFDIYIIQNGANVLYVNNGAGVFTDITVQAGVGDTTSSCSTRIYDYDFDGDMDIVINDTNCNVYYTNRGNNTFDKVFFIKQINTSLIGKQTVFFDFDRDGHSDIYVIDQNARYVSGLGNILYANNGDGTFSDVTVQSNLL